MLPPPRIFEVVEEPRFEQELGQFIKDRKIADAVLRGFIWNLARRPFEGALVSPQAIVRGLPLNPYATWLPKNLVVYYTVDKQKQQVHLESIGTIP